MKWWIFHRFDILTKNSKQVRTVPTFLNVITSLFLAFGYANSKHSGKTYSPTTDLQ
jgi:hypothetical protein